MSYYNDLNNMYDNDTVAFEVLINNAANNLKLENEKFGNINYKTSEFMWEGNKLIFGERAVQEKYANGGGITHVESSLYYMIDKDGILRSDNSSIAAGMKAMKEYIDKKYSMK